MMLIIHKSGVEFGQFDYYMQYQSRLSRHGNEISIVFDSNGKGGRLQISSAAARRLGHALLLASTGPLDQEICFSVSEEPKTQATS
jgi:hypothetical protein